MKTLGNIIWIIFGGFFWALGLLLAGLLLCLTIVGIPLGLQLFKMAGFVISPFGKDVRKENLTTLKKYSMSFGPSYLVGNLL